MQKIKFYVDDSGVLHANERSNHFVYGGYVFTDTRFRDKKQREYKKLATDICTKLEIDEAKAYRLERKHKRSLIKVMSDVESFSTITKVSTVRQHILDDKHSICRMKDYILKRIVKEKIVNMIREGKLNPSLPTSIVVFIDEQSTASDGYYDLEASIKEELAYGVSNFDYGTFFPPILSSSLDVNIYYRSSHSNFLIQASDILANRVWHGAITRDQNLLNLPLHSRLHLP